MSHPRDIDRIQHMLDHAIEAQTLAEGHSRVDLESDRLLNLALVRLLEIIGEAAVRVSEEIRGAYPQVPWRQITDLRNRLIHGCDSVDFDILWAIIQDDVPPLISQLHAILAQLHNQRG